MTLNPGSSGDVIRADDDGTAKWQYVKLAFGPDNTQTIVDTSNPIPVDIRAENAAVTVDNGGTFAVQVDGSALTALQTIDNPVFADDAAFTLTSDSVMVGGAIRDDTLSALSAAEGDAVPFRVNANGALHVTGSSGSTQYAEDSAHTSGDTGTMALAVRNDTLAALADTDGDYAPLQVDADGALFVNVSTVEGSHTDDAAFTVESDTVSMIGALFDDTSTDTVDEGDGGAMRMSSRRELYVQLRDAAGNERGLNIDGSGNAGVTGTVTANLGATDNGVLDNIDSNTTRGSSHYRNIDANAEDEVKGSAGTLHWIHAINLTDAIAYLHLFDETAANVTPGSTTPDLTFPIPTPGTADQGGGFNLRLEHDFANGITLLVTTTTDGSTGDPGTNGVFVNAGYS